MARGNILIEKQFGGTPGAPRLGGGLVTKVGKVGAPMGNEAALCATWMSNTFQ